MHTRRSNHTSKPSALQRALVGQAGYSLPLVLVVALTLVAGAAALVNRTGSTGFGAAFQRQSWDARNIARYGLNTLVSRLNQERNRGLLAARPLGDTEGDQNDFEDYRRVLWNPADLANFNERHRNPCSITRNANNEIIPVPPTLSDIYPNGNPSGWWYINSAGQVSTSNADAVGRFRLIDEKTSGEKVRFSMGNKDDLEIASQPSGKTSVALSIEAVAMSNGQDRARTVLDAVLDVTPKCCRVTLGSMDPTDPSVQKHGNNDYTRHYDPDKNPFGASECNKFPALNPDSFGVVWGAGGFGGSFGVKGKSTEVHKVDENGNFIDYINPLGCITPDPLDPKTACDSGNYNASQPGPKVEPIDTKLPPAPHYYPGISGPIPSSFVELSPCKNANSSATAKTCRKINPFDPNNPTAESPGNTKAFSFCLDNNCTRTYINGNASVENLPAFCARAPLPPNGDGNLHCVVSKVTLAGGNKALQFVTGIPSQTVANTIDPRPIRLYFPVISSTKNDVLIDQKGSSGIEHCVQATDFSSGGSSAQCRGTGDPAVRITQLSFFGCNPTPDGKTPYYGTRCNATDYQMIDMKGNSNTLGYFSYFPIGDLSLTGTPVIEGVTWTNTMSGTGTPTFKVPATGVLQAFELLGINPGEENDCRGSIYGSCPTESFLPKWDFVARSIRSIRFRSDG